MCSIYGVCSLVLTHPHTNQYIDGWSRKVKWIRPAYLTYLWKGGMLKTIVRHACLWWTLPTSHTLWDLGLSHSVRNCESRASSFRKVKIDRDSTMCPLLLAKEPWLYESYPTIIWCQNSMTSITLPDTKARPKSSLWNAPHDRIRIGAREPQPSTLVVAP